MNGRYGQRGIYPPMEGGGFYSPYSSKPQWGAGIQQIMQQIAMKKQMNQQQQQQMQQQIQKQQQQQWERGITEREIALKEEEAQKEPRETRWDFKKQYVKYMVDTNQWDNDQGATYLATDKVPQVPVQVDAGTKAGIESLFGLKDFNQESPEDQVDYIKTYALQKNKPEPGKPVPRESIKLRQDRDKLVIPLVERYEGVVKKIEAAIYELGEPNPKKPNPKHLQYRRQLHNAKKAVDILRYARSVVDGGDELSPELEKLIRQISFKTREVQTGKFFEPDKFGYTLGETRMDKNGIEIMYVGNDGWMDKL